MISTPSSVCSSSVGSAKPTSAPANEAIEPTSASGTTSRRLAMPARRSGGPAESVPASANIRPAPRTKSRWNGNRLPTIGTNSTPPPTPASTATMPIAKLTANSAIGQTHHGTATASIFFGYSARYAEARCEPVDAVSGARLP